MSKHRERTNGEWRRAVARGLAIVTAVIVVSAARPVDGQEPPLSASDGWVRAPQAGEAETAAFANIENPTMYDVYITGATTDAAGRVELRDESRSGEAGRTPLKFVTVPAHDWAYMDAKSVHLQLLELKRPLKEGDTVELTLTGEGGVSLRVSCRVKAAVR